MRFRYGFVLASSLAVMAGGCATSTGGGAGPASGGESAAMGEVLRQGERPRQNEMTQTASSQLSQAADAAEDGDDAAATQHYRQALQSVEQAIAADSTNPLPWYQGGRAQMGLDNYQAADSMLARAQELRPVYELEIAPLREQTWIDLYQEAAPLVNQGEYEAAVPYLEHADAIYDGRPEVMFILGQIYGQLGRYDEAADVLQEALDVAASPELRESRDSTTLASWDEQAQQIPTQLANILVNAGRYDEAIASIQKLVAEDPDNLSLQKTLASLYVETEQPDSAKALYGRLQARSDLGPTDYYQIGIGLYQLEDYENAAASFKKAALATSKDRDAAEMWARSMMILHPHSEGDSTSVEVLDEMRQAAQLWTDLDPYSRNSHLILAQVQQRSGNTDAARDLVGEIEALPVWVDELQLRRNSSGGGTLTGSVQNVSADPGTEATLTVTFYGEDGQTLGTESATVQLPAQDAKQVFRIDFDSGQKVGGYTYDLQM